ncbi:uncharacterized protein LOC131006303 [Salvia miltiorrhiza]|uniref:uncharacterized protein LOC131006303 n=1 Tax=Salvia miltiorrhiza TaxID=226208 RepID=UPI0025AC5282|nr:uncharacterized protein LOC131006303 [Salvia miltiorrhiza]
MGMKGFNVIAAFVVVFSLLIAAFVVFSLLSFGGHDHGDGDASDFNSDPSFNFEFKSGTEFYLDCLRHYARVEREDFWPDSPSEEDFLSDINWQVGNACRYGIESVEDAYRGIGRLSPDYVEALNIWFKGNQTLTQLEICRIDPNRCPQHAANLFKLFWDGQLPPISVLWIEFVREVCWCWEESQPLPRMPSNGPIDLSTCLINQKLHTEDPQSPSDISSSHGTSKEGSGRKDQDPQSPADISSSHGASKEGSGRKDDSNDAANVTKLVMLLKLHKIMHAPITLVTGTTYYARRHA